MSEQRMTNDDRAVRPLQPDKSLGELFGDLTRDMGTLFRQEVQLAKTEAREELSSSAKVGAMFGAAGLAGWMAVLFVSLALAWLLDQAINRALAFVIVGVLWAIAGYVLFQRGKTQAREIEALPETVETLKEDVQWAKTQRK